ncbi:multidrug effflux MFS transporter [Paenibacillus sp. MMO-177]|uniref:multidrug effflux MFS transporter n=1 Tax=Paenibacillus sp. MMO-177 TaxID=3081289 RepID=UPI0030193029
MPNIAAQSKLIRLKLLVVLGSLIAFGPLSLDLYLPALPELAGRMGASASLTQLSLTACMIGLSVGQLFAGPWSDMIGRRKPLLVGMVIYAVTSLLCAVSISMEMLIAMRFIQGISGAIGIVIARAAVRDLYEGPELTRFYASLTLVNGAAPILAPIAGGQLLHLVPWRGLFILLAGWGVLMLLFVIFGLPETLPQEKRLKRGVGNTISAFATLIRDRGFMGIALAQGLVGSGMFAYISGSSFVFQGKFDVSPQQYSLIFAINGIGLIAASQWAGRIAGRIGEVKVFRAGITLSTVGAVTLLTIIVADIGLIPMMIPLFVVVASCGLVNTTGFALALRNYGHLAGSASALIGLMSFLLGGMVAPVVGIAGSDTALPMGIIIAALNIGALIIYRTLIIERNRAAV